LRHPSADDQESQLELAKLLLRISPENRGPIVKWMKAAANNGSQIAAQWLASYFIKMKNSSEILKWLEVAAANGSTQSEFGLYLAYTDGNYTEKDTATAIRWLKKAANSGEGSAQLQLGKHYYKGTHVEKDIQKSLNWFKKAAFSDDSEAQYLLASEYFSGNNIRKNLDLAYIWAFKAAQADNKDAIRLMAILSYKKDFNQFFTYTKKAANLGDVDSQYNMALIYIKGEGGIQKNLPEALKWLKKAASGGDPKAKAMIQKFQENIKKLKK